VDVPPNVSSLVLTKSQCRSGSLCKSTGMPK